MQINNTPAATIDSTQDAASLAAQSTLYSASVAGKTYPANISVSDGEYVATVPQLPGVSASGNSLLSAETNLESRLSLIV
jgi:hypothetical protein